MVLFSRATNQPQTDPPIMSYGVTDPDAFKRRFDGVEHYWMEYGQVFDYDEPPSSWPADLGEHYDVR